LISVQILVVVSHTMCTHARGPKNLGILGPHPYDGAQLILYKDTHKHTHTLNLHVLSHQICCSRSNCLCTGRGSPFFWEAGASPLKMGACLTPWNMPPPQMLQQVWSF